ncbi:MAG: Ig-like domain-containing protein [Myxococcota bacterium]
MLRPWTLVPLALALTACPVEDEDPTVEPAPTDGGDPDPDPEVPLPPTVEVTPPSGWIDVAPRANIVATFSVELDPASVDGATWELEDGLGRDYDAMLTVEGEVLTIDPVRALPLGQDIGLTITGLRLADGRDAPSLQVDFRTHPALPLELSSILQGGDIASMVRYRFDADRRLDRVLNLTGPGQDGIWATEDDPFDGIIVYRYDDQGVLVSTESSFTGDEGLDGVLGTDDDIVTDYSDYAYAPGRETRFDSNSGPDRTVGTADDIVFVAEDLFFDDAGDPVSSLLSFDEGSDGVFLTADDFGSSISTTAYDAYRQWTRRVRFTDAGADEQYFSDDDPVMSYRQRQIDAFGFVERDVTYTGAGNDGEWYTPDDVVNNWREGTDDADGTRIWREFGEPGDDGIWLTVDDVAYSYERQTLLPDGLRTSSLFGNIGADGLVGTPDDQPGQVERFFYDDDGFLLEEHTVFGPGADGEWDTDDDPVTFIRSHLAPRPAGPGTSAP